MSEVLGQYSENLQIRELLKTLLFYTFLSTKTLTAFFQNPVFQNRKNDLTDFDEILMTSRKNNSTRIELRVFQKKKVLNIFL